MGNTTIDADVRYGSSFLDVSNNKNSVLGEIMTDKLTGEVFLKRPQDGKILSFRQRSQTIYESIQEFNIQFQSSMGFNYPNYAGSYLLGTKLHADDLAEKNNKTDILLENNVFSENVGDERDFRFNVSCDTNGFYLKPITRLGDRNVLGFLTGQFSVHESLDFVGVPRKFSEWLDLSTLYSSAYLYTEWKEYESWISSNAVADITVTTTGLNSSNTMVENIVTMSIPIQLDEYSFIRFPDEYKEDIVSIRSIRVKVTKISCPKLQYERYLMNDSSRESGISALLEKFIEIDLKAVLQSIDVFYFVSSASELPMDEHIEYNHCFDTEMLLQAITYLSTSSGSRSVQSQVLEPESWPVDTIWAEELRDIKSGDDIEETMSVNKLPDIERMLYNDPSDTTMYSKIPFEKEKMYIELKRGGI